MKQSATVVEHDGRLMAEVVRSEACQECHACKFGQQEKLYLELGGLDCREGDKVTLEIDEGNLSRASILAYGIPVATFFIGLFAGSLVSKRDLLQALFAFGGLAIGLLAVKLVDKKAKKSGRFTPRVRIDRENGGNEHDAVQGE